MFFDESKIFEILDFLIDFPKDKNVIFTTYLDSHCEPKDIRRKDADFDIRTEASILDI